MSKSQIHKVIFATLLLAGMFISSAANAEDMLVRKKNFEKAVRYLTENNCEGVWSVLWLMAQRDDKGARGALAAYMVFYQFRIPGAPIDTLGAYRNSVIMSAHSLSKEEQDFTSLLFGLLKASSVFGRSHRRIKECLKGASLPSQCISREVKRGTFPSFKEFALEINTSQKINSHIKCSVKYRKKL